MADSGAYTARFAGAAVAGSLELGIFHPVDTVAKRLMNSQRTVDRYNFQELIFQEKAKGRVGEKMLSLFPGFGYGAIYKISQRVYKFGGQPIVKEKYKGFFQPQSKAGKTLCDGVAGATMGAGEVVLLPFDALKIKAQTNAAYREVPMSMILKQEGMALYAGWEWTLARNIPGSFALFGTNALVKEYVFNLENHHRDATFTQNTISSVAGSFASIIIACPCDVIKTRIQSNSAEFSGKSGFTIAKELMTTEGPGGFFKGAVPKVFTVGPKLCFSFTVAQTLMGIFERRGGVFGGSNA